MRTECLSSIGGCLRAGALIGLPLLILNEARLASAAGGGDDADPTSLVEVVMYGIDDDTHELIRYSFRTDEPDVIGEVHDENGGDIVEDIESLGFIPNGPHKGLYGVTNYDGSSASKLVKFDVLEASVTLYPVDVGFGNVEGMVSSRNPETGEWFLYATQAGDVNGNSNGNGNGGNGNGGNGGNGNGPPKVEICHVPPGNPDNAHMIIVSPWAVPAHLAHGDVLGPCESDDTISERNLIEIDPATGLGEMVMQLGPKFEGLAQGPDGILYAAADDELWAIDLYFGTKIEIGDHSHRNVEALEYAYGDYDPHVEVPGVPAAWTADGALFGFSDNSNAVLIFNPATGETVEYECALDSSDIEGMVFMTEMNDPYLWIIAQPCD
ncbi:MAG: hypothetical protein ACYS15_08165 [Planctomycetota bacterium]|jgi:hypothetical protein